MEDRCLYLHSQFSKHLLSCNVTQEVTEILLGVFLQLSGVKYLKFCSKDYQHSDFQQIFSVNWEMLSNQPSTAFVTSKAPAPEISAKCIYLIRIYKIFCTSCLFPLLENEKVLSKNFWITVQKVRGCRKLSSIYFFFVRGFKTLLWKSIIKCKIFGDGRSAPKVASLCK